MLIHWNGTSPFLSLLKAFKPCIADQKKGQKCANIGWYYPTAGSEAGAVYIVKLSLCHGWVTVMLT